MINERGATQINVLSMINAFKVLAASVLLTSLTHATMPEAEPQGRPRIPMGGAWRMQWLAEADAPVGEAWARTAVDLPRTVRFDDAGKHAAVVFERVVAVPADWDGRRVVLRIDHPAAGGTAVTVNGHEAGEIPGYGGWLDVTDHVALDADNTVRLRFFRFGRGLRTLDAYARDTIQHAHAGSGLLAGVLCPSEGFYLESQPREALVADVWFRTYTRGGRRVEPQVTVDCAAPVKGATLEIRILPLDSEDAVLSHVFTLGDLSKGESVHELRLPTPDLTLWWPGAPHLYRGQATLLDGGGRRLDTTSPVVIGVREVWTEGRYFYVNGAQIHLTFKGWGLSMEDAVATGVTMTKLKHANVGTALTYNDTRALTRADQLGLVLTTPGVGVGYTGADLGNPEVLAAYRTWVEAHLRRHRHHPSAFFWKLSMNYAGPSHNPTVVGRTSSMRPGHRAPTLAAQIHRELDPTRLAYHHHSNGFGDFDSLNFYANHLPMQMVEDWLEDWELQGDRPFWMVEFLGGPLNIDFRNNGLAYVTEYTARLAGDAAYAAESPAYRDYAAHLGGTGRGWTFNAFGYSKLATDQLVEAMERTTRAFRFRKVPTDQWIWPPDEKKHPDPDGNQWRIWDTVQALHAPVQAWIGGPADDWTDKGQAYASGEKVEKTLLVVDDRPARGTVRYGVTWEASWVDSGEVVAEGDTHGEGDLEAPLYARVKFPIQFIAPEVDEPRAMILRARLLDAADRRELLADTFALRVYPSKPAPPVSPPIAIIDPEEKTADWLEAMGVAATPWSADADAGILIIGRDALRQLDALPFTANDVAQGLRVVVFEQRADGIDRLGLRREMANTRNVFLRQPHHPLAAGLVAESLHDWRGSATLVSVGPDRDGRANSRRTVHWSNRGIVAANVLETPHFGPFRTVLDTEFDLAYTPLMQWRHGRGEVVFCQMDVTARTKTEPAAETLKRNVVRYLGSKPAGPDATKVAVSRDDGALALVATLGYATAPWPTALDPARHVVALPGDAPVADAVAAFVEAGGDAFAFGAQAAMLGHGLTRELVLAPRSVFSIDPSRAVHELLAGVGPQHTRWREPLSLDLLTGGSDRTELLLDGLVGVIRQGRGRLVLVQLTDECLADTVAARAAYTGEKNISEAWRQKNRTRSRWQANRFRSLLLGNLGLRSSDELVVSLLSPPQGVPFQTIDNWTFLGPFPASAGKDGSPLNLDVAAILKNRSTDATWELPDGTLARWHVPTDIPTGMGQAGHMNLESVYGVKTGLSAVAVAHVWSSNPRRATLQFGADWWFRVLVNGQEAFRTGTEEAVKASHAGLSHGHGKEFAFTVRADLVKGWNEIVCVVGSGSNGNAFWFQMSDPGDLTAQGTLDRPAHPMMWLRYATGPGTRPLLTGEDLEQAEITQRGFSLYTDSTKLDVREDPFLYSFH